MGETTGIQERWRVSSLCPDYKVSDLGRVRRFTSGHGARVGRLLSTSPDSEGYPTVNVCGQPHRVHVLVADAFLGPIPPGGEVHHRNEDRSDARALNLAVKASKLEHFEEHRTRDLGLRRHGEENPVISCACGCGRSFPKFDGSGRPRRYVSGHNLALAAVGR